MLIAPLVQKDTKDEKGAIHISIIYSNTEYQEIVNSRDFDFDSMWSGIGGFVGIFTGYSLFVVPDLLYFPNLRMLSIEFLASWTLVFNFIALTFCRGNLCFH